MAGSRLFAKWVASVLGLAAVLTVEVLEEEGNVLVPVGPHVHGGDHERVGLQHVVVGQVGVVQGDAPPPGVRHD